jgi:NADH-quinone oxidoreductase subunit L
MPAWLPVAVLLLPLLAAVLSGLVPRARAGLAHGIGALLLAVATGLAVWQAQLVLGAGAPFVGPHLTWLDLGAFTLGVGTWVDAAGALMAVLVAGLGTLVLLWNRWYMHGDPLAGRFPWQFCGFVFAMLAVVLADNLFQTFVGWELVGLGSYLLIGFWGHRPAAADDADYQARKGRRARGVLEAELSPSHAQQKAFVMNRCGDFGFVVGLGALLALGLAAGRGGELLGWGELQALAGSRLFGITCWGIPGSTLLWLGALGVCCGAIGKSAQFPLHTWLPDAMQGPTTASSILHAATMVAAGVFLVARCLAWFPAEVLPVVGWIGGGTCLLAATIACVQWDLKAVLAYSTVSQLGLMFTGLAAGEAAGGRVAGLAHLATHAVFKCLLFLCAGAVIHACDGHQDLHRLGGLRRRMPVVAWCSLAGVLAIAGAPGFSGFFSKDAVLAAAWTTAHTHGGWSTWGPFVLASAGSLLTAAYMLRWWLRIFAGEPRDAALAAHAHDPPGVARVVLVVLAPGTLALPWTAGAWLERALGAPAVGDHGVHTAAMVLALALLAVGALCAWLVFGRRSAVAADLPARLAQRWRGWHDRAADLWGIDRLWHRWFTRGIGSDLAAHAARVDLGSAQRLQGLGVARRGADDFESIDGIVDGIARACGRVGLGSARVHGGRLGTYLALAAALAALGLWWAFGAWSGGGR